MKLFQIVFQSILTGVMYQCPRNWEVLIVDIVTHRASLNLALSESNIAIYSSENSLDVLEIFDQFRNEF